MVKKITRKKVPSQKMQIIETDEVEIKSSTLTTEKKSSWMKNIIIILLILVAILAFKFKNLIIVATVDGKPITRWQFESELNSKYGSQVLDNLVSEQIILSAAEKKGITVDQKEVDKKIKEIEDRLKGQMSLADALKAQGLTPSSFREQIGIQLTIDKLFDKEVKVSDKEIDEFIAQNKESLVSATDPAKLKSDVYNNLRQQKIGDLFDKWFADAKKKASVVKF